MKLTDDEQRMLQGECGAFRQKAMEFNIRYASVLGAGELCEVSRATMFIGTQHYMDCYGDREDYPAMFSEFYLGSAEPLDFASMAPRCKVQTCAGACDYFEREKTHDPEGRHRRNQAFLHTMMEHGVKLIESCTPYYVGWIPLMGEHFVTTESSNVVMSNSFFGARGNADGVEAAVAAAKTGKTPKWGMHCKENRYATCLVRVECSPQNTFEWDLLGFTIGRLLPKHVVPVVVGSFTHLEIDRMKQFCSSIAATSATELCHIAGLTPEAQTLEMAVGPGRIEREITVTLADCEDSLAMICAEGGGPVDFISIGCPHLSIDELKDVAEYLRGKTVAKGVELQVWTSYAIKAMATVNGYTRAIEEAGGYVLTGTCPVALGKESYKHATAMVMNGAKQAFTMRNKTDVPVYYGSMRQCLDAAVKGRWEGRQ